MERELAHIAKEEILRNVIKTHTVVLLLGWQGSGKTISVLRAVKGLWKAYYFNAAGASSGDLLRYNSEMIIIEQLWKFPAGAADSALIVDDFDGASEETVSAVIRLVSSRDFPGKIIITSKAQPRLEETGLVADAVVRMKENTAQVLYTRLLDIR